MSMNVGSSKGSGEPDVILDINTTPLIDVMLVLLVMLIITIPIQLHSVNLNMPTGNPPPPLVKPEVQIRGDGGANYDSVGRIIYACQRAWIAKVGFITEPPVRGG